MDFDFAPYSLCGGLFFEVGTRDAHASLAAMRGGFTEIHTVEPSVERYHACQPILRDAAADYGSRIKITTYQGDSLAAIRAFGASFSHRHVHVCFRLGGRAPRADSLRQDLAEIQSAFAGTLRSPLFTLFEIEEFSLITGEPIESLVAPILARQQADSLILWRSPQGDAALQIIPSWWKRSSARMAS